MTLYFTTCYTYQQLIFIILHGHCDSHISNKKPVVILIDDYNHNKNNNIVRRNASTRK